MVIIFQQKLSRTKPNGDIATWTIRVESPDVTRGATIITEVKSGKDKDVVVRKKSILRGKRLRSASPMLPGDMAIREANSRTIQKISDGYEHVEE
ncbi:hypothetical protein [Aliidiomarina quisquiliarum]|uniref:hypothetical protein n=1 Tax=Aliidiomarina quisquiliarum TaxID=2938947 RepID=UPI00208EB01D|nr:hypothetical protein [Aliidiomarina quisquiliarum]MCO4319987.1 hypothetical protein [Aliidiomarina quisquiliarum]